MMNEGICLTLIILVTFVHGHYLKSPNNLHPVHGLYVKPSADGTTGDLYVAATENSGTQTQWLTEQAVNFLPVGAATQQHQTTVPCPKDENSTHKRAVLTSPPVQYAYAVPFSSGTEGAVIPYPYVMPATQTSTTSESNPCPDSPTAFPSYNPFQFFYPHMMSAYANVMSILKESGMSDDKASSVVSSASPMWSPYGAYPMYIMVDPAAWTQMKTTTSTTPQPNEN